MIEPLPPVNPVSPYWENRISYETKWKRVISICETPVIRYDANGNLVQIPDSSFSLGSKYV